MFLLSLTASLLKAQVTQNEADVIIQDYIKNENIEGYWLYSNTVSVSKKSEVITLTGKIVSPNADSWIYFIDEQPFANWSHQCRYLFISTDNGEVVEKQATYPPVNLEKWRMITEFPKLPKGEKFDFPKRKPISLKSGGTPNNCYAVIISGGADTYNNWERYWNDCSAIYLALVNVYGYLDDHIYVLISDGTNSGNDRHLNDGSYDSSPLDLDGDGDSDIQFSATRANITSVFNTLSGLLTAEDFLFIFTTDHGGWESGDDVYLNLWGEIITDDQFAIEVDKVNAGEISTVMGQCHSGGFISDLSQAGRVIATACKADEVSYAMPPDYTYDEFVYHWTAAVASEDAYGNPVDADTNNDGSVSMQEAFTYAEAHDTRPETPQYNSNPGSLGEILTLLGSELCPTEFVHDETITSDRTISGCNVDIDNVTIENNANVIIDAENEVLIHTDFLVSLGSTLEIR